MVGSLRAPVWLALVVVLVSLLAFPAGSVKAAPASRLITVSVVATTDVHGRAESLPWLGGYLANLRARRATDGGVLLIDAGDMFQGTLESNLGEGAIMVRGYGALGYQAAAIGNHEFDFGPAGPLHLAGPGDDPRGALKARAAEARFPFLSANVQERGASASLNWPNVRPFTIVTVAGVRFGIIGLTTASTPFATHPRNFSGLEVKPLAQTIIAVAQQARAAGAQVLVVTAHAGGICNILRKGQGKAHDPDRLDACEPNEEIFTVARALPAGTVDMIAAGHTHQMVAHRVNGIAIVQAQSEGRAFGRVDLRIDAQRGRVAQATIFPPQPLCGGERVPSYAPDACRPRDYEGQPVRFDQAVAKVLAPDVVRAEKLRAAPVGVDIVGPVWREAKEESPLGNLAADLMRAAAPGAEVAFINGGSLRASLPPGPLHYGRLYEAFPFDDGLARVPMTAGQLTALVTRNLERSLGILSLSGVRARARCVDGRMAVELRDAQDRVIPADRKLDVVTNGYLASGGDALITGIIAPTTPEATPMRDRFAELLRKRGGQLRGDDPQLYSHGARRMDYPGRRPVRCR
jgi:2',3'-cyclic-nucleotide 2'-phosphodiesterase (5'-nucleotidase family)